MFTSDLHFGHANANMLCRRPWATVEEMNAGLTANWNSVVQPEDTVYVLGDFAMGVRDRIPEYLSALNGHKYLVVGNHDIKKYSDHPDCVPRRAMEKFLYKQHLTAGWEWIHNYGYAEVDGKRIYMTHIPCTMEWYKAAGIEADVYMCGHVHNAWVRNDGVENVGVDVCDYRPMTLEQILARPQKLGESHRQVM